MFNFLDEVVTLETCCINTNVSLIQVEPRKPKGQYFMTYSCSISNWRTHYLVSIKPELQKPTRKNYSKNQELFQYLEWFTTKLSIICKYPLIILVSLQYYQKFYMNIKMINLLILRKLLKNVNYFGGFPRSRPLIIVIVIQCSNIMVKSK